MSSASHRPGSGRLAAAFSGIIRDRNWERQFDQHRVFPAWEQLVDKEIAKHCRPLKVVKDVLWLEVDHSAWMQQMRFQKLTLLETLNDYLEASTFSDIRFTVREKEARPPKKNAEAIRFVPPPAEDVAQFKEQVACIDDEQTREALVRLWYLSQACQRE